MRFLLDTHTFIWWDTNPTKLSGRVLALCHDPANTMVVSVVSAWEMQIKIQIGKLQLATPLADMIDGQQQANGIEILPVALPHVLTLPSLPLHHKDPFDRLIAAQALSEGMPLASADPAFAGYPITVVW